MTVTLLDGLVLARSVFYYSINYRSIVLLSVTTNVDVIKVCRKTSAFRPC
ncbi:hypothetical protein IQ246_26260 [aff. Roholtiella sp. LEGE 12411]|nr:hypothetical protein [aff. Roholtiella sp. LEGE 12411]